VSNDPFNADIPDDSEFALLCAWWDLLRPAKQTGAVVAIRLASGSLHVGTVDEVKRATVALRVTNDGESYNEHIALRAIAALTVRKATR
jgi:hypothetical protein